MVSGTYQSTVFSECPSPPGPLVNNEDINFIDPTGLIFATGMWYGADGACPHTFQTDVAPYGPPISVCDTSGFPHTVNFQFELDTAQDVGLSDPHTIAVTARSVQLGYDGVPLFSISYQPDQSAEMGPCTQCQAQAGAPINVITGNTWIQQTDYTLPGLSGGIELARTWNSMWSSNRPPKQVGMFGDGWTSTYEESLSQTTSGLKYWSGAGTAWAFVFNQTTGAYTLSAPSDARATLVFDSTVNQYTLTFKDGRKRVFDSSGRLIKLLDRNANSSNLAYDSSGHLITVTDAASRNLTFAYSDPTNPNQVTTASDAMGIVATFTYAPNGVLSSVRYGDGSGFNYTSDPSNLITSVADASGVVIESHTYDGQRRGLTSAAANNVNTVSISYIGSGTSQLSDSFGNVSSYSSQSINRKHYISSTSGVGCATCGAVPGDSYLYDSQGNRTSTTDALGRNTSYTYDSNANLTSTSTTVNGLDVRWSYTYNSFGQVLTATDPLGHMTTNTYDANGNILTTTTPSPGGKTAGSKTSLAYDTKGELTQITDPLGHITKITYTPAGLVSTITDPLGKLTTYGYDDRGNRTLITDPVGNQTTFQYDARNRLTKVTRPDLTTVTYAYDTRGRRTSVTDENNKTTTYGYDGADRLVSVSDANGGVTQYAYDTENNLTSITDAALKTTSFTYDPMRRLLQTTFPSTKGESYAYDAVGNLISKTDRKGQIISYTYDELNRLTQKQYPNSTAVSYAYDLASQVTQVQDPSGTYSFVYDNMSRLTSTSTVYSFLPAKTFTVSYAYDAASNRTGLTDPNGGNVTYTYDALDRLTTLKDFNRNSFSFGFDALSRRTSLTRPNAVNSSYQYDGVSNLVSVLHQKSTTVLDGAVYAYDGAGNRKSSTNKLSNVTSTYGYDNLYQLSSVVQGSSTVESYTYDAVGNRLSSLATPAYTYDTSNELQSAVSATYIYDANGNTVTKTDSGGITAYAWDVENRLTSVTLPNGSSIAFTYDPFGRRIKKNGSVYIYDGLNLIQESDSTGNLVARYVQGSGTDQPLVAYRGSTTEFYESDGLGSITSLSTTAGSINQTYLSDSFGNATSTTGTFTQPFRYTGREFDSEIGLYYNRARYYDAGVGRFLNEDPIMFGGGDPNFYAYVLNNPTNSVDFLGTCPCPKVPTHPGYVSIDRNIAEAETHKSPFGITLFFPWWYNQVRTRGPWDYKQQGKFYDDLGRMSRRSPFEDFGNFNYGATAAANGIPEWLGLKGAGWASLKADPNRTNMGLGEPWSLRHPFGVPPYGDDPDDQAQIKAGYDYYRQHCKETGPR